MGTAEKNNRPGTTEKLLELGVESMPGSFREAPSYLRRFANWLSGLSENTRRVYAHAVQAFFSFTGLHPKEVGPPDVAAWKEKLKTEVAETTVDHRLSALSSYYRELSRSYGGNILVNANPVTALDRRDLDTATYKNIKQMRPVPEIPSPATSTWCSTGTTRSTS